MAEESKFKRFIQKVKNIKHIEIIIAVIAVVVMLLLYFSSKITIGNSSGKTDGNATGSNYCKEMEAKLQDILSSMKGVGKTKILIHWESGVESVSENTTTGTTKPNATKEIYPKALGVIIICQGGDDVKTRINIMNAVSVLLDITQDKIIVYAMGK